MKSHVSMEQHYCPICSEEKDTGTLLLDRRMRDSLEMHTTTGVGICIDCKAMGNDGYVALVGVDPNKSEIDGDLIKPSKAHRISEYLWLKRSVAEQVLNVDVSEYPFVYIDQPAIEMIKKMVANQTEH